MVDTVVQFLWLTKWFEQVVQEKTQRATVGSEPGQESGLVLAVSDPDRPRFGPCIYAFFASLGILHT